MASAEALEANGSAMRHTYAGVTFGMYVPPVECGAACHPLDNQLDGSSHKSFEHTADRPRQTAAETSLHSLN